jgi:DnaJ domain
VVVYLALGILALVLGLWLMRAFIEADPARLARGLRVFVMTIGLSVALVLLVILIASGRLGLGVAELGGLAPLVLRGWTQWRRRQAATAPPPGQVSEVETDYLRMRLDHATGIMSGVVRRGAFQGRSLVELGRNDLVALWRECRAEDMQGARLLESYLDRTMPDWRNGAETGGAAAQRSSDAMSREEAYAVLGLAPGASEAEIREAYHRLMMKIHPDQGGSTYLATQINRAREVLLGG